MHHSLRLIKEWDILKKKPLKKFNTASWFYLGFNENLFTLATLNHSVLILHFIFNYENIGCSPWTTSTQ